MTGIYKITNIINGKVYVGQAVDIKRRWQEHCSHSFSPTHISYNHTIHRAIRKYGIENFTFEVLEECAETLLNEKEIYWIAKLNSKQNGYNMTDGGDSTANNWDRRVEQYSLKGEYIATYSAIRLAARSTGIDHAAIGRCCNNKVNHAGGYLWVYEGEKPKVPEKVVLRRKIGQYDLSTNELIAVHNGAVEAVRAIGKNNPSNIRNVCYGKQKYAYGYFWKYVD